MGTLGANPKCTAESKQMAVGLYRDRGGTYAEIAREVGVDAGAVSSWVKTANGATAPDGGNAFERGEEPGMPREENARHKRESEVLLKASASFATKTM